MKAIYTKEVGEMKITVCVEFEKYDDDVADLMVFLGFPLKIETSDQQPKKILD